MYSTSHEPILNHTELVQLVQDMCHETNGKARYSDDTIYINNTHLHLPAMIFGENNVFYLIFPFLMLNDNF